jgi:hypothetical protein
VDSLQFQKAEYASDGPKCAACQATIDRDYYHLAGQTVCPPCAEKARSDQQRPPNSAVIRGLLFGAGAALACSIGYAIIRWNLDSDWALFAIAVGYVVGKAVRKGSKGLGGRRCQVIALALTYVAITFSYLPVMFKEISQRGDAKQKQEQKSATPAETREPLTAGNIVIVAAFTIGLALAVPLLGLSAGFSGIITIIIIGLGLMQAWRLTARDPRLLMGPYEREGAAPVG